MFRLIKLGFYALIGYVLYELYQGMTAQQHGGGGGSRSFGSERSGAGGAGGRTFTGAGQGQRQETQDFDGGSTSQQVGRGVTM